ncbi:MAG: universal stress protein [Gammaproteobacteria bacterium]|nr:universal stress protein [Gammaproteobacteria bacterium]
MTIKNLLVHIDHSQACQHRVKAAIDLSRQFDARLTALFVVPDYFVPSYVEAQISTDVITQINDQARERAEQTMERVKLQITEAGLSVDSYIEDGNLINMLTGYARYTDLLILGQNQPNDPDNLSDALADHLVLEAGSPCLVVPHTGCRQTLGNRVLLAWNESRESARALKDALPLLKQANMVTVLFIKPKSHNEEQTEMQKNVIRGYLADHDIDADISTCIDSQHTTGDVMLAEAIDNDIDLIVMGAYGHSRLREIILGGATRHLLQQMTVPVFISH